MNKDVKGLIKEMVDKSYSGDQIVEVCLTKHDGSVTFLKIEAVSVLNGNILLEVEDHDFEEEREMDERLKAIAEEEKND